MRGAIQIQKGVRGLCGQNTLQHLDELQLHFRLRSTKVCVQQLQRTRPISQLSQDDDFPCGLVFRQLFKRQVHSWFFFAKNLKPTFDLRPHSVYPSS